MNGWRRQCRRTWTIIEGDFSEAPSEVATWFIDPPYVGKGRYYRKRLDAEDYERLAAFSKTRVGQVIACEGPSATWLPFRPLGVFKSSRNRAQEFVWTSDAAHAGALAVQ